MYIYSIYEADVPLNPTVRTEGQVRLLVLQRLLGEDVVARTALCHL